MAGPIISGVRRMGLAGRQAQRGAVAVIVAVSLLAMIAMVGLVVDLGRAFVVHSRLQIAADACALAGIQRLDRTSKGAEDAYVAGKTIALRNLADSIAVAAASAPSVEVLFGTTLSAGASGDFRVKAAIGATEWPAIKYVRCKVANDSLSASGLLAGITSFAASAMATSEMLGALEACAVPLAACARDLGDSLWGLKVGEWISAPSGTPTSGNFGWAKLTTTGNIAEELENGVCNVDLKRVMTDTGIGTEGERAELPRAWNSRLGVYHSSYGPCNELRAPGPGGAKPPPDKTGYGFQEYGLQSQITAYGTTIDIYKIYDRTDAAVISGVLDTSAPKNYLQARESTANFQRDPPSSSCALDSTQHAERNRPRRLVAMPVVQCSDWGVGGGGGGPSRALVRGWLCGLMVDVARPGGGLRYPVEVIGRADSSNSPCGGLGVPTSNSISGRVAALVQ